MGKIPMVYWQSLQSLKFTKTDKSSDGNTGDFG